MTDVPKVNQAASAYVKDTWTEAQHRAVRARIQEQLVDHPGRRRAAGRPLWALAAAVGVVAALVGVLTWSGGAERHGAAPAPARAALASTPLGPGSELGDIQRETQGVFADGSAVRLAPASKLRVLHAQVSETRLELVTGRAEFEVQKAERRAFVTLARGVEVRVLGTRFEIDLRAAAEVRVVVTSGVVEVRPLGGATWTRVAAGGSLVLPQPGAVPVSPTAPFMQTTRAIEPVATSSGTGGTEKPPPAGTLTRDSASLFKAAGAARTQGQVARAMALYSELLASFPGDARAGLAAFELGRLRLDAQHDAAGAAAAFRRAMALAPNAGLREDASARLVEALDAMKRWDECQAERSRYLSRHPGGVHSSAVRARCQKR